MSESLKTEKITAALLELRSASMVTNANPTDSRIKSLINKYDIIFISKKINQIDSFDLYRALNGYFDINIEHQELMGLIPLVCDRLNMKYDPLIDIYNMGKTKADFYQITLW